MLFMNVDICTCITTMPSRQIAEALLVRLQPECGPSSDHVSDTKKPFSRPKTPPVIYTPEIKMTRENKAWPAIGVCKMSGVFGQSEHVGILSQNYFAREFTRFWRAQSWRNCQIVSQNSPSPSSFRAATVRERRFALHVARPEVAHRRDPTPCPQTIRLRIARIPDE